MTAQDDNLSPRMTGVEPSFDRPAAPGEPDSASPAASPAQTADTGEAEKLRAELAEAKDRALRATAELENYRRRAEKEREDTAKYAIANFAREVLTVADNLRRALDSQPKADGEAAIAMKAFVSGVELTERELAAIFERFGIKKIDPMNEPFNHDLHQAMFELEDASKPAGTVVQVMQAGYTLKERLLRPALVGVSKGGAAQAAGASSAPNTAMGANANDAYASAPSGDDGHNVDTKA